MPATGDQHRSRPVAVAEPLFGDRLGRPAGVEPGEILVARLHQVAQPDAPLHPPDGRRVLTHQGRPDVRVVADRRRRVQRLQHPEDGVRTRLRDRRHRADVHVEGPEGHDHRAQRPADVERVRGVAARIQGDHGRRCPGGRVIGEDVHPGGPQVPPDQRTVGVLAELRDQRRATAEPRQPVRDVGRAAAGVGAVGQAGRPDDVGDALADHQEARLGGGAARAAHAGRTAQAVRTARTAHP